MVQATTIMSEYGKTCPDCNGKPFVRVPGTGKVFFGIFKTPDTLLCCARCKGAGVVAPQKVILHPGQLNAEVRW